MGPLKVLQYSRRLCPSSRPEIRCVDPNHQPQTIEFYVFVLPKESHSLPQSVPSLTHNYIAYFRILRASLIVQQNRGVRTQFLSGSRALQTVVGCFPLREFRPNWKIKRTSDCVLRKRGGMFLAVGVVSRWKSSDSSILWFSFGSYEPHRMWILESSFTVKYNIEQLKNNEENEWMAARNKEINKIDRITTAECKIRAKKLLMIFRRQWFIVWCTWVLFVRLFLVLFVVFGFDWFT